jgi:hypothetical protein
LWPPLGPLKDDLGEALEVGSVGSLRRPPPSALASLSPRIMTFDRGHTLFPSFFDLQLKMLVFFMDILCFYDQMVYFRAIWYVLGSFGIFFPVLVCRAEKNLANLETWRDAKFGGFILAPNLKWTAQAQI